MTEGRESAGAIKVLIVDDVTILRDSLRHIIEKDDELCVVGTASNGHEALNICQKTRPDIILMDLKMPVCDGVQATLLIKKKFPNIKVIILTTFNDDDSIRKALKYGACGYVLKDIEEKELISTIKNTYKGLSVVHHEVLDSLTRQIDNKPTENICPVLEPKVDRSETFLNNREIEIISLISMGKTYKEIAKTLYIAEGTLRNIVSDILKKLNLSDKTQLIVYAVKNKLI